MLRTGLHHIRNFCMIAAESTSLPSTSTVKYSRQLKSELRELRLAMDINKKKTKGGYEKLLTISRKSKERNELTGRVAAIAAKMAIDKKKYKDAELCLRRTVNCTPHIVERSLRVVLLAREKKLDEALDVLEKVLHDEDILFDSANAQISNQALDELHAAIESGENTLKQMKRFRGLQRAITEFGRRSPLTLDEVLHSEMVVQADVPELAGHAVLPLTNKVLDQIPHFLYKEPEIPKVLTKRIHCDHVVYKCMHENKDL